MPRPDEPFEPIFLRKGVKVLMHLFARRVDAARARVRLEAVGVIVGGEVARYPLYHKTSDADNNQPTRSI